jgi:uncharacterized peroxidase-related enzyme
MRHLIVTVYIDYDCNIKDAKETTTLSRIKIIDPTQATGKSKELLTAVHNSLKVTPNLAKVLANSPAALQSWIDFNGALGKGSLDAKMREAIALVVAQENACEYCLSAHTAIGKLVGLTDKEILSSRQAQGTSPKITAALEFSRELVEKRGQLPASRIEALRDQSFTDGEIAEIIANVALNLFTNYFNIALDVDVDFPRVATSQVA